jgi:hypothetical protein
MEENYYPDHSLEKGYKQVVHKNDKTVVSVWGNRNNNKQVILEETVGTFDKQVAELLNPVNQVAVFFLVPGAFYEGSRSPHNKNS